MAGIYIPNVDISGMEYVYLRIDGKKINAIVGNKGIMIDAKAIAVPDHGRCVDADVLMTLFKRKEHMVYEFVGDEFDCSFLSASQKPATEWDCVEDMLECAPTILPADKGCDNG